MFDAEALALSKRAGFPDALRVLLEDYPRKGWEADSGFDELIRFWLDRHLMFRRLMDEMQKVTRSVLDRQIDPARYASTLSRYGGMFVEGLHQHHTIEDTLYFPKLRDKDRRITRGFDILEADHHVLDAHLSDFVTGANATIGQHADRDRLQDNAGDLLGQLGVLDALLNRHLEDEEDLIVPVLLKFGSPHHE